MIGVENVPVGSVRKGYQSYIKVSTLTPHFLASLAVKLVAKSRVSIFSKAVLGFIYLT